MSIEIKISKKPVEYYKAFKTLEKRHLDVINNKKPELIWILEHPSVFTAGVSFKDEDLFLPGNDLPQEFYNIDSRIDSSTNIVQNPRKSKKL